MNRGFIAYLVTCVLSVAVARGQARADLRPAEQVFKNVQVLKGIPADELKRIFKRFYRVPGRARSHAKGTGLGLFIVRAVARAHGGKVFAVSGGEGKGTTVTLELPRSEA